MHQRQFAACATQLSSNPLGAPVDADPLGSVAGGSNVASWRVAPVLIVRDVEVSLAYYRDHLGFKVVGTFGEPLEMVFVGRGGVQVMLQDAERKPTPGPNCTYESVARDVLFRVPDARELFDELKRHGAEVRREPYETLYGHLQLEATDPDGHVLCFSQPA